ncbi:tRNA dimethylallyltransferase, mitochondrial [Cladophialophora carrionii]|uniref:tRNA dimethylallyltransferase n=1 Tax=Cladophialophora carrionii TaxID=86049 RepID=A0A1C1CPY5_9EURO|nr:tRNA dimethylallyltransferase, mitochondrial [Cladophialophora carrionii]
MASSPPKDPLIMVIGATGTGKSKLAVELATRFNGEIINCDAMQMYKGLPIITNKIPENERDGIPHHLLDFIDLREKPWSVQHFVRESSRIIDAIRARGKLPIIVGGTIYYTFSLLFNDAILSTADGDSGDDSLIESADKAGDDMAILSAPTEEIFAKLREVDPEMAQRWHPNDRNKIRRSLEIYLKSGRKASDIYAEQRQPIVEDQDGKDAVNTRPTRDNATAERKMSLRYSSLVLWLEAEDAVLKQRLDARVDAMVADGLCGEVVQMAKFESELRNQGQSVDLTNGIWASIGYKEMKPWLKEQQASDIDSARLVAAKEEGIEAVKASTRRYAKRQNRFVRIRLAKSLKAAGRYELLYLLDCTDLARWPAVVGEPAEALVEAFVQGRELPRAKTLSDMAENTLVRIEQDSMVGDRQARICEVCNKTLMTEKEWNGHLTSRSHKKITAWRRRQELLSVQESRAP